MIYKRSSRLVIGLGFFVAALTSHRALAQKYDPSLFSEIRWRCIGPFRGGRTVAVSGVPGKPNVFYIAAVNGGVWKTDDFGGTWKAIFDEQPTGSIGAMAIASSNSDVIYVGSGEGLQRPDLSVGDGIFRSSDGGQTWRHLGLPDAQQIASILVDPRDPDRVFAAVLGHPYGPNAERGVFRSTDGGKVWAKVLYKDENTGAADLAFDPKNAETIYAVLWAARVAPWEVRSGGSINGPGSGMFKSIDGGTTWHPVTRGLPTPADGLGRMGIAVAPSNVKRLYASIESGKLSGVYRSDDAGESWERVNQEARIGGRGPGAMGVAVAPDNPDVVYVANTSTYRSTDGGHTFMAIKGAPGGDDYQRIWISPENPQIIALSSDQGAVISVNGGQTWSSWYNQPTAQFYHVITDNRFPYWVYGAQQESGSVGTASRSDYGEISFREWHPVGVEEYGYIAPDPRDANILYGGRVTRTNQALGEVADVSPEPVRRGEYRYNRSLPVVFSPLEENILYFAANVLFKTADGGRSWERVSPDLTREKYDVPANLGVFTPLDPEKGKHRGVIYALAPSFKDAKLIWAGTDDGLIQVTHDAGKTWTNVTPPELTPWSKVSVIEASHYDSAVAYAAINRFRLDDLRPHIYRTRDAGKSWQEIVKGLAENAPVNTVREDPVRKGLLFAGTERSVFVSFDDGDNWQPLQLNLPHTSMRDLTIHGDDLIVGTHGRSFWILDDINPLRELSGEIAKANVHLYRPQTAYRFRWNRNPDTPLPWEVPAGKNPPDGAIIDYYMQTATTENVMLEILDGAGKLVRRYSSTDQPEPLERIAKENPIPMYWIRPVQILSAEPGMHRFVWDMHYPSPDSLSHEYPISAIYRDTPRHPLGASILPGRYTVKLTVAGESYTQPLEVRMDPRIKATGEALAKQFALASGSATGMNESYVARKQVQALRAQLKERKAKAATGAVAEAIAALDKNAAALEGETAESFFGLPPSGKLPENFSLLNQHFAGVLRVAESADAEPTTQALALYGELQAALQKSLAAWNDIKARDVPQLNERLRKSNLAALTLITATEGNR